METVRSCLCISTCHDHQKATAVTIAPKQHILLFQNQGRLKNLSWLRRPGVMVSLGKASTTSGSCGLGLNYRSLSLTHAPLTCGAAQLGAKTKRTIASALPHGLRQLSRQRRPLCMNTVYHECPNKGLALQSMHNHLRSSFTTCKLSSEGAFDHDGKVTSKITVDPKSGWKLRDFGASGLATGDLVCPISGLASPSR